MPDKKKPAPNNTGENHSAPESSKTPGRSMRSDAMTATTTTTPGGSERGASAGVDIAAMLAQISQQMNNTHKELKNLIASETKSVRDDLTLELAQVTRRLEALERQSPPAAPREPFDPTVTVVLANLPALTPEETEANLLAAVYNIVSTGLELPGIELVNVKRLTGRGTSPGLVLIECFNTDDKITILRAKAKLREKAQFKNLYMRSAEGHSDRLVRLNFQTILEHMGVSNQFRFTGSGRLVKREAGRQRHASGDHGQQQAAVGDAGNPSSGNAGNQD